MLKIQLIKEKLILISLVILTLVMIVLRFLLNEKGRVSPDSIRFFRTAKVFPVIDNTTTPLGYPLSLKFLSLSGIDEFWSSKIIGILSYLFIVYFAWKKKFYLKEAIMIGALVSYVSIFSYTMTEPFILPFVFAFLYISRNVIIGKYSAATSVLYLSLLLILLYNIRYSALFIIGSTFLYGLIFYRKKYGKPFIISGILGFIFVILYKFVFVDVYNENYIQQFLEIGLHPTSKLLVEFFQGLTTSFNPLIHIADPRGGIINYSIYGIGGINLILMLLIFIKTSLCKEEKYLVFVGIIGILCSYFVQYFYSVNKLDYRLLSPFLFSIWMVYFKKLYQIFGRLTYIIPILSLATCFIFSWLSRGNYLENRRSIISFLEQEDLKSGSIQFYAPNEEDLDKVQIAELISTVNPEVSITFDPKDTLKTRTLTQYKVLRKIKIKTNKFQ